MATTPKGYPYPVGTDRVMDGDDAIKALAEAVDSDALYTRATTVGQGSLVVNTATPVLWNPAAPNGAALTKTSTSVWTVTKAGLYVITAGVLTTGFTGLNARNYVHLTAGNAQNRQTFAGENTTAPTVVVALIVGDTISVNILANVATNVAPDTGFLNVVRLGRT